MSEQWSPFSYIVTNLARFIRPDEITFSGVNSTMPMLACLMAKRAYDFDFAYTSRPSWATYASLLEFARVICRDQKDLRPADQIDAQGFIWVQGSDEY